MGADLIPIDMMGMRQRFRPGRLALAVVAGFLIASCGGGDNDGSAANGAGDPGPGVSTSGTPPSTTQAAADPGGDVFAAEFVGDLTEVIERGGRILKNRGEFEVTDDGIVGSVTFSAEGQVGIGDELADEGAIACVQVEVVLAPGALTLPEEPATVEVTVQRTVDLLYRACPPVLTAEPSDEVVTVTVDEDGRFSGSFLYEGATTVEFVATPSP